MYDTQPLPPSSTTGMDKPANACVLCPPPRKERRWRLADDGYKTCSTCLDKVRSNLLEIGTRWDQLDARPGASGDHGSRGAPGFGSRPPGSTHVITMRDPRSRGYEVARDTTVYDWDPLADTVLEPGQYGPPAGAYTARRDVWIAADGRAHSEDSRPTRSIPGSLASLAAWVAEEREVTPPQAAGVRDLVYWLDQHLDWITRQDGLITDVRDDVRALVRQLRPVTGEAGRKPIGFCPNTVTLPDGTTKDCGERLYAPLKGDRIECYECERVWEGDEWLRLGALLTAAS